MKRVMIGFLGVAVIIAIDIVLLGMVTERNNSTDLDVIIDPIPSISPTATPKPTVPATINGPILAGHEAEALQGHAQVSQNKEDLIRQFERIFPGSPALIFVDADKPFCAAMIANFSTKEVKAQCFSSSEELDQALKNW